MKGDPTPTPKVQAAGIGGALATILVVALEGFGVDVSPELAAAIATVVSFGFGYIKKP